MSTRWTVTIDCAHPATLTAFWRLALGYVEGSPPTGFVPWAEWLTHTALRRRSGPTVLHRGSRRRGRRQITRMREHLVQGYFETAQAILKATVGNDLPGLEHTIQALADAPADDPRG